MRIGLLGEVVEQLALLLLLLLLRQRLVLLHPLLQRREIGGGVGEAGILGDGELEQMLLFLVVLGDDRIAVELERAQALERRARALDDTMLEAGFTRFRPVLMTALAMIIGMIPMAFALGEGGEQNAPLGRAVVGGLTVATIATLFFVPTVFSVLHRHRGRPTTA